MNEDQGPQSDSESDEDSESDNEEKVETEEQLHGLVAVNGATGVACFDGGCEVCLVTKDYARRANLRVRRMRRSGLTDLVTRPIDVEGYVIFEVEVKQVKYRTTAKVVEHMNCDVYLARPWLSKHDVIVHHRPGIVQIGRHMIQCAPKARDCEMQTVAAVSAKPVTRLMPNCVNWVKFKCVNEPSPARTYELSDCTVKGDLALVPLLFRDVRSEVLLPVVNLTDRTIQTSNLKVMLMPKDVDSREIVNSDKVVTCGGGTCGGVREREFVRRLPENESEEDIEKVLSKVKIGPCEEWVKKRVQNMLRRHHQVFSRHKWDIGRMRDPKYNHSIKLKKDAVPKKYPHYRVAIAELQIVKKFITKMKEAGLIEESTSQWASPLMLISKHDDPNERRPVVNCKYINSQQICEATYLPRVDELLDFFTSDKKFLSKLDLTQMYFQLRLNDDESRDICSFSTPLGNYRSLVMLQGDANAPNRAQRTITDVLKGIESCIALIDDIAVCDRTLEEHLEALEEVFARLLAAGLTLRPDKVELLVPELSYLGFTLQSGGKLKITHEKVEVVRNWPRCKTISEIKSFLGFTSYVRRFCPKYSEVCRPLLELAKNDRMRASDWTPECEKAFQELKILITTAPVLVTPDPKNGEFHVFTDASDYSCSFVLAQKVLDEKTQKRVLKPCAYGSRLFRGSEKNYVIATKEILGCVHAMKKLRHYLFGQTFHLHVDNICTYHVLRNTGEIQMNSRLARFAYDVYDLHFHCHFVRSEANWSDALSRLPVVKGPDGELEYRREQDEEIAYDPKPPPKPQEVEIDPLWAGAVTRGLSIDNEVVPGFVVGQKKDVSIQEIMKEVEESADKKIKKGKVVYKIDRGVLMMQDKRRRPRYVIPQQLVTKVIAREHTEAHLGISKTLDAVSRRYYWPGWTADVATFVKGCFSCQTKKNKRPEYPPLADLPRPTRAQEIAAIDIKGEIIPPSRGLRYVIVVVDLFTRYAWTKAVPRIDGATIAEFLINSIFEVFGQFECILSDNAANLKSGVLGYLYPKLGVEAKHSLPYFAQSNGAVERLIGTIGTMIRCATTKADWSTVVPRVTNVYNNCVHRATGYAPQHLHMGYAAKPLPKFEEETPMTPIDNPQRYLLELKERRAQADKAVLEGLREYYNDEKARVDEKRNASAHRFYVGQLVLSKCLGPRESKALDSRYEGPAEVISVTGSSCEIVFLNTGIIARRSVTHLRPYYESTDLPTPVERYTGPRRGERRVDEGDGGDDERLDLVLDHASQQPEEEVLQEEEPGEGKDPAEGEEDLADLADDDDEDQVPGNGVAGEVTDQAGALEEQDEDRPQEEGSRGSGKTVTFDLPEDNR